MNKKKKLKGRERLSLGRKQNVALKEAAWRNKWPSKVVEDRKPIVRGSEI